MTTPSAEPRRHLSALTGVRALAALWVVLHHFDGLIYDMTPQAIFFAPFFDAGYLGVDLFFALSGFILAYQYFHRFKGGTSKRAYGGFIWKRMARVWPVHVFTLNVMVLMLAAAAMAGSPVSNADGIRFTPIAYVENLFMVHAWFGQGLSFNAPAWSISAEWFAYLIFPVLILALAQMRTLAAAVVGVVCCYGALAFLYLTILDPQEGSNGTLFRVAFEFAAGCFLFLIWERASDSRAWIVATPAVVVASIAVAVSTQGEPILQATLTPPLLGLLVLCLACGRGFMDDLLSNRIAVFWGLASYSLYMTHEIVHIAVNQVLPLGALDGQSTVVRVTALAGVFALTLAVAAGTYKLVESPFRRALCGQFVPRRLREKIPAQP